MFSLEDLDGIVGSRARADAAQSYTRGLLDRGAAHCARKFGEEAVEAIVAATAQGAEALTAEAADVLYHLLVLLRARDVPLAAVMGELERRTRRGGLAEKASRGAPTA